MERKRLANAPCPIARTLDLVGEWWSLLIIREALIGVTRFDDFQKALGVSRNALTERLKRLVEGGVLAREPVAKGARREAYVLTPKGTDLFTVMVAMVQWGNRWQFEGEACRVQLVERGTGQEIETLAVRSRDGHKLHLTDIDITDPLLETDAAQPEANPVRPG